MVIQDSIVEYLTTVESDNLDGIWKHLVDSLGFFVTKNRVFNVLEFLIGYKTVKLDSNGYFSLVKEQETMPKAKNFRHAVKLVNKHMIEGWSIEVCEISNSGNLYAIFDPEGNQAKQGYGSLTAMLTTAYIWTQYKSNKGSNKIIDLDCDTFIELEEAIKGY